MNLQNKILITLFALGTIFWGCDSLIYDDLADCPQGVYVKFYSMTPCASDSTFLGSVASLTLFAFDENDRLATSVTQNNVTLDRDYNVLMPVSDGKFSFVAWAGVNDNFTLGSFINGTTTKKDVMLTLKTASGVAANLSSTRVWQGESPVVFLPNPSEYASFYEYTAVNLQKITNRITLVVEFDKASMEEKDIKNLDAEVSAANGTINIDGSMPAGKEVLKYTSDSAPAYSVNESNGNQTVTWNYNLLDLKTGFFNNLYLSYKDDEEEGSFFDGDLIGSILLTADEKGGVNLDCENDFTIKFVIRDACVACWTHMSCDIWINDWQVHSYSTSLGN